MTDIHYIEEKYIERIRVLNLRILELSRQLRDCRERECPTCADDDRDIGVLTVEPCGHPGCPLGGYCLGETVG